MKKRYKLILVIILIIISILIDIKVLDNIHYDEEQEVKVLKYYKQEKEIDLENEYIGILTIDKINLHEGFYHILSSKNKLKSGIKVIKEDMDNLIVLASHSGNSKIAKFNRLSKLKDGDIIKLSFNNKNYTYMYDHMYHVEKTGHVYIDYDKSKLTLVLITCDLKNNNKQEVHIAYMV